MMKKLKEGAVYEFRVEKKLPDPVGIDHFILKGPDEKKYLLPAYTYNHYGITTGDAIKCRVDKINCRGKIFLEPANPCYSEGKAYEFIVIGNDIRTDLSGNEINVLLVKDIHNKIIPVPCEKLSEPGSSVNLVVERISKGRLYLFQKPGKKKMGLLVKGRKYKFRVDRTGKGLDDQEYYILRDSFGDTHAISRAHYEYYGFSPGDTIQGEVVKHKKSGEKIIEPENPFYKTGRNITLKVTGHTQDLINNSFTLDLIDKFGFTHCIQSKTLPESKTVRCRVKMIRKGKPLLIQL